MRALVCTSPGELAYEEITPPVSSPGRSIISIKKVCVCGTDIHAFEGTQPFFEYPRILGHELSGVLVETDAPGFSSGELVTVIPYFNCGKCIACRNGKPNCCTTIKVSGVHIDGGLTELLSVPSYALVHGEGLSARDLAMVEPLAIGAHGVARANIQPGEFVLVVGAGPIGLCTMEFVRLAGGNVIAMDVNNFRLDFCQHTLNILHSINGTDSDVLDQLSGITGGDMPTVVIDATGNQRAINNGINFLAHGGRYVLIGLQKGDLVFSHPEFHKRESTLMSSRNATRKDFEYVISSIKNGSIDPSAFIDTSIPFAEAAYDFKKVLENKNMIKAIIEM